MNAVAVVNHIHEISSEEDNELIHEDKCETCDEDVNEHLEDVDLRFHCFIILVATTNTGGKRSQKQCATCPRHNNKKTPEECLECKMPICRDYTIRLCPECHK